MTNRAVTQQSTLEQGAGLVITVCHSTDWTSEPQCPQALRAAGLYTHEDVLYIGEDSTA